MLTCQTAPSLSPWQQWETQDPVWSGCRRGTPGHPYPGWACIGLAAYLETDKKSGVKVEGRNSHKFIIVWSALQFTVSKLLTHWGQDKMAAFFQTTFSNGFSWMKMHEFWFDWSLFLRFKLTIFQHWFRWWLGAGQATSHYLNQWWSSLLTYTCMCHSASMT